MESEAQNIGSIENSIEKRLNVLTSRWNQLMIEQDQLSADEVASEGFQSRKKRISGLYQRATSGASKAKSDAVRRALESVGPDNFRSGAVRSNTMIGFKF